MWTIREWESTACRAVAQPGGGRPAGGSSRAFRDPTVPPARARKLRFFFPASSRNFGRCDPYVVGLFHCDADLRVDVDNVARRSHRPHEAEAVAWQHIARGGARCEPWTRLSALPATSAETVSPTGPRPSAARRRPDAFAQRKPEIPWACGAAGSRFARLGLRPKPPKGILRGGGYDGRYNTGPRTTRMRKPMQTCFGVVLGLPLGCRFWHFFE